MKKIIFTAAIATIAIITSAKAQVSIGVNIGTPAPVVVAPAAPVWVPAGAPSPYYYFPDINCYYDMGIGQYIYFENNRWLYSRAIPPRFVGYNFRGARMVPMNHRVFMGRGIPAYRGGGRQAIMHNNYVMQGHGNPHWNNGNHFGQGGGGHWKGESHGRRGR
ncbi:MULTISPECIES: hypothetical protein [Chitinophagaceae]